MKFLKIPNAQKKKNLSLKPTMKNGGIFNAAERGDLNLSFATI